MDPIHSLGWLLDGLSQASMQHGGNEWQMESVLGQADAM